MKNLNYGMIIAAAMLLGNPAIAQNNVTIVQGANDNKSSQLFSTDAAAYKSENTTYALPWERIMEDNVLWQKRVWRNIDTRDKENKLLGNNHDAARNSILGNVLVDGFFKGAYKAYEAKDDRFTTELTREKFIALITPGSQAANAGFNPEQVTKFRVKEDWLFLEKENKIVVRIIGIAPLKEVKGVDGKITDEPVFWLFYPDIRNHLAQRKIVSKEHPDLLNWDQVFETRQFNGTIDKVASRTRRTAYQ